jgi:hypothetical protein
VDAELSRGGQARLLWLSRDEHVVARVRGVDHIAAAASRDDRDALDHRRALGEDQRLPSHGVGYASGELRDRHRGRRSAEADLRERSLGLDADGAGEASVVSELGMRVEGEVVGEERHVGREERLEPPALPAVDEKRLVAPEEAVVDDEQVGAGLGRALEELEGGRDAARKARDVLAPEHLRPGRGELGPARDVEELVRARHDRISARHDAIV